MSLPPSADNQQAYRDKSNASATAQVAGDAASSASRAAELASLKVKLRSSLRQFPDFPSPGILFEDILPIFADPALHESLIRGLELHLLETYGADQKPDVIVGLDARGFLFGPTLALRLGAAFVPVRKQGKLPGPVITQEYQKEYGSDFFQMQSDAIKPGQKVIVVDDIIATERKYSRRDSGSRRLVRYSIVDNQRHKGWEIRSRAGARKGQLAARNALSPQRSKLAPKGPTSHAHLAAIIEPKLAVDGWEVDIAGWAH
ncbi:adenine phosphoribosyltransferase [Trichophyton mentagrophytes]|nr:adenine phosphoribosyltransferase [Trichophyton mentagrophytes]